MKIMVVDDEQDVQILFQQKFRRERREGRIDFQFALSAREALEYIEDNGISEIPLVLSDINMPGMNGIELLKVLKERYSDLRIFMITAYGNEEYYNSAIEHGADDYITKPVKFEALKDRIFESY